ncbi:HD domain-containing protein [Phocaeicola paurosaccharolyticus]|uniref:HD domain-containing protein n=1 Tax=Phocaeicola paurosaccharolyticus TaxID=732242 RepID=UPI0004694387|nr:HD domain-containing protein [Phocaeicola paurosaccharolyticus]
MNENLKNYIEDNILPQYINYDKAHQRDHIETVIEESLNLAEHFGVDMDMAYAIAAYHDLGIPEGRETHHITSAKRLLADKELTKWFSDEKLKVMAEAIEDHRASSKNEPRSIYGKIVAEADRNIDTEIVLRRIIQYGISHFPDLNKEEQYARMLGHLYEKYAEGGYIKLWIPESRNAKKLAELRLIIKDDSKLRSFYNKIYDSIIA